MRISTKWTEFSQYTRDGLIFEFATATDDEIISAGGEDYLKQRDSKKSNLKDGEELKGKEFVPEIIEKAKKQLHQDLQKLLS